MEHTKAVSAWGELTEGRLSVSARVVTVKQLEKEINQKDHIMLERFRMHRVLLSYINFLIDFFLWLDTIDR